MALYIDFNYVDIRDYVDLSQVDVDYENYLQSLAQLSAEIQETVEQSEGSLEKVASDIFKILEQTESTKPAELINEIKTMQPIIIAAEASAPPQPIEPPKTIVPPKKVAAPTPPTNKQQMYIDYINGKYDKSLAQFFINILENPFQTFVRSRFEIGDTFKQDLSRKILRSDENSVEQETEKRHQTAEHFRKRSAERLASQIKNDELNKLLEAKRRSEENRV